MTWANIKLEAKEIYIPAAISKTKKDRLFQMSDNLHLWLSKCDTEKPLITPNLKKLKEAVIKASGIKWISDGLRHSFATYHYAKYKNLELLRSVMGNSPNVIERFYKGAVPQAEVERFWNII